MEPFKEANIPMIPSPCMNHKMFTSRYVDCHCQQSPPFLTSGNAIRVLQSTLPEIGKFSSHTQDIREWKVSEMTPEQLALFNLDLGAVRVLRGKDARNIAKSRLLPTRFILTNEDASGETLIAKSRLVWWRSSRP